MSATASRMVGTVSLGVATLIAVVYAHQVVAVHPGVLIPEQLSLQPPSDAATGESNRAQSARRPDVYFDAVEERPLFAPSRRPVVAASILGTVAEPELVEQPLTIAAVDDAALVLLGTMQGSDGWLALIRDSGATAEWQQVGARVADLTITAIGPDWATLASETTEVKLELYPQ